MVEPVPVPCRRIGLLGGTFDPPHRAHVALARQALRELQLDEVWWIPAGDPWQKRGTRTISPASDRLEMVRRAVKGEPRFRVEDLECRREGPSYAIDTVRELQRAHPGVDWIWILGEDAYRGLPTWKAFPALAAAVSFAVARRGLDETPASAERDATLPASGANLGPLPSFPGVRATALDMPPDAASSTAIRATAAAGADLSVWLHHEVARYIDLMRLYNSPRAEPAPPASTDAGPAPAPH